MSGLQEALSGRFVIVNLGAAGDPDYILPRAFREVMSLVEIDSGDRIPDTANIYWSRHRVRSAVAGSRGKRRFTERKFWACSSLHEPREHLVKTYGLERYFEPASVEDVETETIPELLERLGVGPPDFLKTDLEGEDFPVVRSCMETFDRILAIQCELRFQPLYRGEPNFHEVVGYLAGRGFDLVGLRPEYWKPKTPRRDEQRDGRVVFADCLFFRRIEDIPDLPEGAATTLHAKQIIIASMTGKRGYAEWLFESSKDLFARSWQEQLAPLTLPVPPRISVQGWKALSALLEIPLLGFLAKALRPWKRSTSVFDFAHVARTEDNV